MIPFRSDQPQELGERRIRPEPRRAKVAPTPEPVPQPVIAPEPVLQPPAALEEESAPVRPDRTRMDPLSLDRSTARKQGNYEGRGQKSTRSDWRRWTVEQWLVRVPTTLLILGGIVFSVSTIANRVKREASQAFKAPAATPAVPSLADRIPDMLEAFLTAPDVASKAASVLDRARVQPLMEAAYASGRLPEDRLRFGVVQPMGSGVYAIPARVSGPPPFVLHLMVREEYGEPLLDWETYEQEITQKFAKFAAKPGQSGGQFRLVLERTHDFSPAPGETVAVRVAAPGSEALANPVIVRPDIAPSLADALPWNRRRRALAQLDWETPVDGAPPRMVLREVLQWEFMP